MEQTARIEPSRKDLDYKELLTNEILKILNSVKDSENKQRQEITNLKRTAKKVIVLLVCTCTIIMISTITYLTASTSVREPYTGGYLVENLQGDAINTWISWDIVPGQVLHVNIVNQAHIPEEKINVIKGAILSKSTISLDNSIFKESAGGSSTYYLGWEGAIASENGVATKYYLPANFDVTVLQQDVGDVTIYLMREQSPDGLSGLTKNVADGNQILRSKITIFEADKLSDNQIAAVMRHEFGHALGLAHSGASYDLMHATIQTNYPYISACDMQALSSLYDGDESSQIICTR